MFTAVVSCFSNNTETTNESQHRKPITVNAFTNVHGGLHSPKVFAQHNVSIEGDLLPVVKLLRTISGWVKARDDIFVVARELVLSGEAATHRERHAHVSSLSLAVPTSEWNEFMLTHSFITEPVDFNALRTFFDDHVTKKLEALLTLSTKSEAERTHARIAVAMGAVDSILKGVELDKVVTRKNMDMDRYSGDLEAISSCAVCPKFRAGVTFASIVISLVFEALGAMVHGLPDNPSKPLEDIDKVVEPHANQVASFAKEARSITLLLTPGDGNLQQFNTEFIQATEVLTDIQNFIKHISAHITDGWVSALKPSIQSLKASFPPDTLIEDRTLLSDQKKADIILKNPRHATVVPLVKQVNAFLKIVKMGGQHFKPFHTDDVKAVYASGQAVVKNAKKYTGVHFVLQETFDPANKAKEGQARADHVASVMAKLRVKSVGVPQFINEFLVALHKSAVTTPAGGAGAEAPGAGAHVGAVALAEPAVEAA